MERTVLQTDHNSFLKGGGEMGELIRQFDWFKTPVGSPEAWPLSLRTLISMMLASRFPMLIFWGSDLITFYNDAFRPSLGNNGKHPSSLGQKGENCWAESWPKIGPFISGIMAGGESVWFEDQRLPIYRNSKMDHAYWTYSISPVTNDTGAVAGVLVTCAETTRAVESLQQLNTANHDLQDTLGQNRALQKAQQDSDAQFIHVTNSSPTGLWLSNEQGSLTYLNKTLVEWTGMQYEDLLGTGWANAIIEEDRQRAAEAFLGSVAARSHYDVTFRITKKDGQVIWCRAAGDPYYREDGSYAGYAGFCMDIDASVGVQLQVEQSREQLRNIILQAPVAMCIFRGPQHVVEIANERMLTLWGKPDTEVLSKPIFEGLPEARGQGFEQMLQNVYTTGETVKAEGVPINLPRKGRLENVYVNFVYQAYRETDGSISGIMAVANEVTEQVKAIQLIELAEERARLAIHSAELGVYEVNRITGIINADARFHDMFDSSPNASWDNILQAIHPDDRPVREQAMEAALQTGHLAYQVRIVRTDASIHWIRAVGKVLYNDEGEAVKLIGVVQDITEQKQFSQELEIKVAERTRELAEANKQLQQSNAELNQFAYIASHDLQEPLRKVRTFTGLLASTLTDAPPKTDDYLKKIESSIERMQNLIQDVLSFSRLSQETEKFERVNLNLTVQAVIEDYELLIEQSGATITAHALPVIEANPVQMIQLFTNLISNALKFRRADKKPDIFITSRQLSKDEIGQYAELNRDEVHYSIECTDNGIGFEQEYAKQIFVIFQRLHGRSEYQGTGIGLAMCKKIVVNHHGIIHARSRPGEGASFTIMLPESYNKILPWHNQAPY